MLEVPPLPIEVLPAGIGSRFVADVNGLRMHVLEAGSAAPGRPCLLLLHGFPELAYSWRKIMPALAEAGFHVIAPDQRGYGRTVGWSASYDDESAEELAKIPTYYIMDLADDMPTAVAKEMLSRQEISACQWLPDDELAVYAREYERTGFQGGLNWYRSRSGGAFEAELQLFSGRTIDVPSIFISGKSDWGVYQRPDAVERMQDTACTRMVGCHLLDGAGHWVQQEQAAGVSHLLLEFLKGQETRD